MAKRSSVWDRVLLHSRPLTIAQGEVGYAYNLLQDNFFNAFMFAMALERPDHFATQPDFYSYALALWHVFQNDKLQRQLAMTALQNIPTKLDIKDGVERLEWARKKTDKLAEYRNLIAHTPVSYRPQSRAAIITTKRLVMVPRIGGMSTKPLNAGRLGHIKNIRFWAALRNDFLNLNDYVDFVTRQLWSREYERRNGPVVGALRSWPRKPKLPCVRRIDLIEQAVKNRSATLPPRRRKRPRPSHGKPRDLS